MARKVVLVDDYDGKELPEDTQPVNLSLGRTTYNLYLSEGNHGKLMEALEPFIKDAETTASAPASAPRVSTAKADRDHLKQVRAWAIANKVTYKGADGEERTLGDRGRIPQELIDAYEEAEVN